MMFFTRQTRRFLVFILGIGYFRIDTSSARLFDYVPKDFTIAPVPWPPFPWLRSFQPPICTVTPPVTTPRTHTAPGKYDYDEVLAKSIFFYQAQRSGKLPYDSVVWWRGDSAMHDHGVDGEDLVGGWYDAGDSVKFGFTMASTATVLLWGLIDFQEGYSAGNLMDAMYDCVKWPLDYFMKAHTKKYEFYAQVGNPYLDHSVWTRPEDMHMGRPAYSLTPDGPGSDVVAETAAALAAGAIAFNKTDQTYAARLLVHAMELFDFAERYRGNYQDTITSASEFYPSSSDVDELTWAAAWLFRATGKEYYLRRAQERYEPGTAWAFSWDEKKAGAMVLLYRLTHDNRYYQDIVDTLDDWLPGGSVQYTPLGLAYRLEWGTLRYTANMAMVALMAADLHIKPEPYRSWARSQIHYMLGDAGRSYVIGFGHNPPQRPHHSSSSCPPPGEPCTWNSYVTSDPNPNVLFGALVGGPDLYDYYVDDRSDYIHNEVSCDYNAGFQSAVAGLRRLEGLNVSHGGGRGNGNIRHSHNWKDFLHYS